MIARTALEAFAKDRGFVKYQLDSFNDLLNARLQKIVSGIGVIQPDVPELPSFKIKLGRVKVGEPSVKEADGSTRVIHPMEARLRNQTYSAPVYVEMTQVINEVEERPMMVHIGNLPVMVKSAICPLARMNEQQLVEAGEDPQDPGGYFIVNGTERALVLVEEIASNRIILEKKEGTVTGVARVNSERDGFVQRHIVEMRSDGLLTISFANVHKLPLIALLKALRLETDKDIIAAISMGSEMIEELYANIYETDVKTVEEGLDYIGKHLKVAPEYRLARAEQIVDRYLLPHIGQKPENRVDKAFYLAKVAKKLINLAHGKVAPDDLDHYANKRLRMAGDLIEIMFRSILLGRWGLITRICYNYQKLAKRGKVPSIQSVVESNVLTNQLVSALATGAWVGGRTGVSQRLERTNFIRTLSHLRNVLSPLTTTQEHFEARELHLTHWGRLCPAETPEGPSIGLRKYLALMAEVTPGLSEKESRILLDSLEVDTQPQRQGCDAYYNGKFIGVVERPDKFVDDIRKKRRQDVLSHQINIAYFREYGEIRINTDSGRLRRPLIIVENGKPKLTDDILEKLQRGAMVWSDLVRHGIVEFLDAEEEENALVALTAADVGERHTHLEIDPVLILGISASIIPFPEHNRGDRVNYGAKMMGQALGVYASNFLMRMDTKSNIMIYPQKPLITTETADVMGLNRHPSGQNIVVAIMPYGGYNIEDAIVINKASVERGLFRSVYYRMYETDEKKYWGGQEDHICVPEPTVRGYRSEADYKRLGEDGIINAETPVAAGDVLVGKVSPLRFLGTSEDFTTGVENKRESSVTVRHGEKGIVDKVAVTETADGNRLIKVMVRDERIPELGDKLSSRHGQKGVIGLIVPAEDLPFNGHGVTPDIVFNPHSVPSRMTMAHLLEMLAGKASALDGQPIDATGFGGADEKDIRKTLERLGFRNDGKEELYNGRTGEKYEALIYTGVIYYQKLDHMVANKIHARSRGPVALLTKQPTEGRAKEGGLRLGEMEKDCIIGHGAAMVLKERFDSDRTSVPVCSQCGLIGFNDKTKKKVVCPVCGESEMNWVEMSYAFKLMLDELKSMLMYPRIRVGEK